MRSFQRRRSTYSHTRKRDNPEARFQKLVIKSFKEQFHGKCHLRETDPEMAIATGGRSARNKGRPDIVGHVYGLHVEIELKMDGNYPSVDQKREIRLVTNTGGIAFAMVHDRKKGIYYAVMDVDNFSYRHREGWIKLTHIQHKEMGLILLEPINYLLLSKAQQLHRLFTETPEGEEE